MIKKVGNILVYKKTPLGCLVIHPTWATSRNKKDKGLYKIDFKFSTIEEKELLLFQEAYNRIIYASAMSEIKGDMGNYKIEPIDYKVYSSLLDTHFPNTHHNIAYVLMNGNIVEQASINEQFHWASTNCTKKALSVPEMIKLCANRRVFNALLDAIAMHKLST